MSEYTIRSGKPGDIEAVTRVELACFPAAEAADRKSLMKRLETFPESFLVAEDRKTIIGFINGAVTDRRTISDEMFEDISLHNPAGAYQSVFGLDVMVEYRGQGVAVRLMKSLMERARHQGRKGMILTCKERLIGYYEGFGYVNLGVSASVHGKAVWYDMILEF